MGNSDKNLISCRTGIGYDVHQLVEGRKLILGGVDIPFKKGLLGHSDADVLVHATMDAICGALAIGDIGKLFPDTDDRYKDISSLLLLERVVELMDMADFQLGNLDTVVCCQQPKLAPYIPEMKEKMAEVLHCPAGNVSVKATTTEQLGFVGREEGIAALASVLLVRR